MKKLEFWDVEHALEAFKDFLGDYEIYSEVENRNKIEYLKQVTNFFI